jgi:hypothetical protein
VNVAVGGKDDFVAWTLMLVLWGVVLKAPTAQIDLRLTQALTVALVLLVLT